MKDKSQQIVEPQDDAIISLNDRRNPVVSIVGQKTEDDSKFASVVDLGDIDRSRTAGADAAYNYLNGIAGQFKVMTTAPISSIKIIIYTGAVFIAGAIATFFVVGI